MATIAELEHRVQLAQDAIDAARQAGNEQSVQLHAYRAMRAEEALLTARIEQGEL